MPNYSRIRAGHAANDKGNKKAEEQRIADEARDRDLKDVDALHRKIGKLSYAGYTWDIDPEEAKKPVTDLDIVHASGAARRLHEGGNIHAGLGEKTYNALHKRNDEIVTGLRGKKAK